MFVVLIHCPQTGKLIDTGVTVHSQEALLTATFASNVAVCPACGRDHAWQVTDVTLKEVHA